jgi:hypothetical protein
MTTGRGLCTHTPVTRIPACPLSSHPVLHSCHTGGGGGGVGEGHGQHASREA